MNSDLKCPSCGSYDIKQAHQLHIGRSLDGTLNWTTRKYRDANNVKYDTIQSLVVPPLDDWFRCNMCNSEFDSNGAKYDVLAWVG